jgi:hypothetical protein
VQHAQRFQEMARHGIYQKLERFLIKSFVYICEGLVLVHRHFLKPRNDMRNPINIDIRREIIKAFGLDADKTYEQNLIL